MTFERLLAFVIAPLLLVGCSSTKTIRVAVPPRVDLRAYPSVGLVSFASNGDRDLERISTQKFLQSVQSAQPGTRVIELGSEKDLLASVGRKTWDASALKAVREAHGVEALVIGRVDVEKAKPKVELSTVWKKLDARADVDVALTARLLETGSNATMWTDSAALTTTVAHASFGKNGRGSFGAGDPEAVYGPMVNDLVWEITDDFREHYVTRRVPKDEVYTSGRD